VTPEETVREVFARVRAGDIRVAELYATDATLTNSDKTHEGREAIIDFYTNVIRNGGVQPQVEALYVNLPTVVAVLRVSAGSGVVHHVADVFQVAEGSIRSMRACMLT
jgi:ketosteroid isomerase-like protein